MDSSVLCAGLGGAAAGSSVENEPEGMEQSTTARGTGKERERRRSPGIRRFQSPARKVMNESPRAEDVALSAPMAEQIERSSSVESP